MYLHHAQRQGLSSTGLCTLSLLTLAPQPARHSPAFPEGVSGRFRAFPYVSGHFRWLLYEQRACPKQQKGQHYLSETHISRISGLKSCCVSSARAGPYYNTKEGNGGRQGGSKAGAGGRMASSRILLGQCLPSRAGRAGGVQGWLLRSRAGWCRGHSAIV